MKKYEFPRTCQSGQHLLASEKDVYIYKSGYQHCLECRRATIRISNRRRIGSSRIYAEERLIKRRRGEAS